MKLLSAVIPAILANDSKRLITIQDISSHFLFTEYDIGENHGIQSTSYKSLYRRRFLKRRKLRLGIYKYARIRVFQLLNNIVLLESFIVFFRILN